ncbi:solute:proton antiporter [Aureococcus anophagefferens]|nr:solute:proton antiporter [Aureococcus anophagefferens]
MELVAEHAPQWARAAEDDAAPPRAGNVYVAKARVDAVCYDASDDTLVVASSELDGNYWTGGLEFVARCDLSERASVHLTCGAADCCLVGPGLAASRGDGGVVVYDREGFARETFGEHDRGARCVAVEGECVARRVASGSADATVKLWTADAAARRDEIGDVAAELEHVESLEHRVEQDLTRVFADFANGTAAPGGGLAGWPSAARLAERLRDGKVAVNYETGEVASLHALLSPSELKRLADQIGTTNLSSLEAHLLRESYLPAAGSRRFARERQRADPAMLHLDTRFLQDMVALSLATAIGGLVAAFLSAPHTLGYMLGGVVVGPSCLDLIRNLEQAETLAQFGSIFLLFSHGLIRFGHTIVELLSVQDLVLAPLLALPTAVHELRSSSHSRPGGWMLGVVGGYAGALGVVVLLARRALPRALGHLTRDREADARPDANASLRAARRRTRRSASASSALALAMALLGDRLKLSHEAGALFAGLVLVGTPHVDKAKRAVSPLAALFGGMYVASLGLVASPQYVRAHFGAIMGRVTVVVVIKVAVVGPMVYALGFAGSGGAGFAFARVSESRFVAAHHLQLVTRHTYLDVLSTTIVLLAIAPLFIHVLKRVDRKQFLSLDKDTGTACATRCSSTSSSRP